MSSRLIALLLCFGSLAPAQELLYSIATDVPGVPTGFGRQEVLRLAGAGASTSFLPPEAWAVLLGDRDGNGLLDDASVDVDAVSVGGPGGLSQWLFSTAANFTVPVIGTIRDGDVFSFDGTGGIQIVHTEDFFAQITGCSTVDVDAFAVGAQGQLYFSFAEDEVTVSSSLATQNGGTTLDEQTLFRFDPGTSEAVIHFTKDQVVAFFNQALGVTVTTVVDLVGVALDPGSTQGDLLLACGSTSAALQGRVVTTAAGGQPFLVSGQAVEPANLGLGVNVTIDALAVTQEPAHPVLRGIPSQFSIAAGGFGRLVFDGLNPGEPVQIVATEPILPGPFAWMQGVGTFGSIFPNPTNPTFDLSFQVPAWMLLADATGHAEYVYSITALAGPSQAVVQGFLPGRFGVTSPAVIIATN